MLLSATSQNIFLQIGATRDGLDPYLDASRHRSMKAVLIETPDYLQWRRHLGRRTFDFEFPVEQPTDPNQIQKILGDLSKNLKLILPGFDRYVESAYALAAKLHIFPWRETAKFHFQPPDKWEQRRLLFEKAPSILQPAYTLLSVREAKAVSLAKLRYPLVIKPTNGGGGLGVFFVENSRQLETSLVELEKMINYDGSNFNRIIAEEYVPGVEYSIQGISQKGEAVILTMCEKFILKERISESRLSGFREAGHVATSGYAIAAEIQQFTQSCLDAFGYDNGPFHIDLIKNSKGSYFLEMGFRLSGGGLVNLIRKTTGIDWAEASFANYLQEPSLQPLTFTNKGFSGQIAAVSAGELEMSKHLRGLGFAVETEEFSFSKRSHELKLLTTAGLNADLTRHTGHVGRITVSAPSFEQVKRLLQMCASTRLDFQNSGEQ